MSGFADLAKRIRAAIDDLTRSREPEAVQIASNLYAQIQNRIIQTGKDKDGDRLPGYSTAQVPKYWFHGRSRNTGADARVRASKKKTLSYSEFRSLNSLQTNHVDLYFTGEMWRETGVTVEKRLFRATHVRIQGKTPEAAQKVEWNSARYGNILEASTAELEAARRAYVQSRIKTIGKYL
mgnify:CR=1 FL=1